MSPLLSGIAVLVFASGYPVQGQRSAAPTAGTVTTYSDSAESLKQFLWDGVATAKNGDGSKLEDFIRELALPDPRRWFAATYGGAEGESDPRGYILTFETHAKLVRKSIEKLAREGGEITTRRITAVPPPGPLRALELDFFRGLKRPTNFYFANWKKVGVPEYPKVVSIGYFVFTDGKFRLREGSFDGSLDDSDGNGGSGPVVTNLPRHLAQSISGTKYTNSAERFTMTVPDGWKTNDVIAQDPGGVGEVSDPNGEANVLVLKVLNEDSAMVFAQKIDKQGDSLFSGYKKVGYLPITVDGREGAALTYTYTGQAAMLGIEIPRRLETWFVIIPTNDHYDHSIIISCTTLEGLFGTKEAIFRSIVNSFHMEGK